MSVEWDKLALMQVERRKAHNIASDTFSIIHSIKLDPRNARKASKGGSALKLVLEKVRVTC